MHSNDENLNSLLLRCLDDTLFSDTVPKYIKMEKYIRPRTTKNIYECIVGHITFIANALIWFDVLCCSFDVSESVFPGKR